MLIKTERSPRLLTLGLPCGIAILAIVVATGIKLLLPPMLQNEAPFLLFFAAVMVSALYGGLSAGILAAVLAAGVSHFFFLPPVDSLLGSPESLVLLALFLLEGSLISHTIANLKSAQRKLQSGEQALSNSELRFRTLVEQSPLGILIFSTDGFAQQANRAWEHLWGTTVDQVRGYNLLLDEQAEALGVMPLIHRAFSGEAVILPPIY